MQKFSLITALLACFVWSANAQIQRIADDIDQPTRVFRLSILPPGVQMEQKLANNFTVLFKAYLGIYAYYSNINGVSSYGFDAYPFVSLEPRYYVTMKKRIAKGKITDHYSAAYIGVPVAIGLTDSRYAVGPVYGFQRSLGKMSRGYWNISFGYGFVGANGNNDTDFIGDFGIGIRLGK